LNLYLVEDNPVKAERICAFLNDEHPHFEISVFGSFQSGLKAIAKTTPDILILDMTLPTFDRKPNSREGRIRPLGGYDLMRKLKLRDIVTRVVVLTQLEAFGEGDDEVSFEEITMRCRAEFPSMFKGSIYFSPSDIDWQGPLATILSEQY
jgi:DNA-binding response OmpR family regulator